MTIQEYQTKAHSFVFHNSRIYPFLGLAEEVGEVCGKLAKYVRAHNGCMPINPVDDDFLTGLSKELGDVCWMVAECASVFGLSLYDIMVGNIAKLEDRKARGVIIGEGDNR